MNPGQLLQSEFSPVLPGKTWLITEVKEGYRTLLLAFFVGDTVDGWNPAPPGMYKTL